MKRDSRATTLAELRAVHREAARQLTLASTDHNVVGSMLGVKLKGGRRTRTLGLTVLVREKRSLAKLGPSLLVPPTLSIGGTTIATDVLAIGPMQAQAGVFPPHAPLLTYDGFETGTLSCFGRSEFGDFGITCAHSIAGQDRNPHSPAPVAIWSPIAKQYQAVGRSGFAVSSPGTGYPGEFGFSDVALFSLEHLELAARAQELSEVDSVTPPPNTRVWGFGAMKGRRTGVILGLDTTVGGMLVDVVIAVDPPGTYRGDSGMMWCTAAGECVAIHAYGENLGPGVGSRLTAGMFAERAEEKLGVRFLA